MWSRLASMDSGSTRKPQPRVPGAVRELVDVGVLRAGESAARRPPQETSGAQRSASAGQCSMNWVYGLRREEREIGGEDQDAVRAGAVGWSRSHWIPRRMLAGPEFAALGQHRISRLPRRGGRRSLAAR